MAAFQNRQVEEPQRNGRTPYTSFGGIQGNVGTNQIPNVSTVAPEALGYMSDDMEAQVAAYNLNNPTNSYRDIELGTLPVMGFNAPTFTGNYRSNIPAEGTPYSTFNQKMGENNNSAYDPDGYFTLLRGKESTNDYTAVNRLNYLGGYQMGAAALVEAGLVKKGTSNKGLNDPKNWNNGLSKEQFLNSPAMQDVAVRTYTNKNKQYLGDVYTNANPTERRGLLASSHLIGAGQTKKDRNSKDANNVSGQDYYDYFTTH